MYFPFQPATTVHLYYCMLNYVDVPSRRQFSTMYVRPNISILLDKAKYMYAVGQ